MRQHYDRQHRFDCTPISELALNFDCRDEIIPILTGLQYLYLTNGLRNKVVNLVAQDINEDSRRDVGRPGFDDWQIVVLAAVRLGCNFDYDKLQDQAENHRSLRTVLGVGDWDETTSFSARRIQDTLSQLKPETIAEISHAIVRHGQELHGDAAERVRADSFVIETNIHHPTESSLIGDGMRKIIPLCVDLANMLGISGWRQHKHWSKKIKRQVRNISRISASKSPKVKEGLNSAYEILLNDAENILNLARTLRELAERTSNSLEAYTLAADLKRWIELTVQVCDTTYRRIILDETVPNADKLFSIFETHTQLYRRGKAATPNQFGRLVLVFEDGAGFISHYHLMDRDANDADVIVAQTRETQKRHKGEIKTASFDRGFHSSENEIELSKILDEPCVAPDIPINMRND